MTTDDLRTRAREAAERTYPVQDYRRSAFVVGFLAHAAQQPSREQIAQAIADSDDQPDLTDEEAVHHYGHAADAVIALLGGPPDERNER